MRVLNYTIQHSSWPAAVLSEAAAQENIHDYFPHSEWPWPLCKTTSCIFNESIAIIKRVGAGQCPSSLGGGCLAVLVSSCAQSKPQASGSDFASSAFQGRTSMFADGAFLQRCCEWLPGAFTTAHAMLLHARTPTSILTGSRPGSGRMSWSLECRRARGIWKQCSVRPGRIHCPAACSHDQELHARSFRTVA